jgi:transcriptional regulator with XRE-family HTH domain
MSEAVTSNGPEVCCLHLHEHFGSRLRSLRANAGLSQKELALLTGMSQPAVARLEGCAGVPKLPTLQRLGGALRCDFTLVIPHGEPK